MSRAQVPRSLALLRGWGRRESGQLPPNLPREQALAANADHWSKLLEERIADEVGKILRRVAKSRDVPPALAESKVSR